MTFKKLLILITFILSSSILAHEGHDSATAKSLYGGVVKKTKNAFVEVLQDEAIEIYISNHDYKSIVGPKLEIKAVADIKGKKIPLKLEMKKTNYVVVTDLSKEKHFKLNVILKNDGKEETVIFPLEKN
jgi:hypothetical protein